MRTAELKERRMARATTPRKGGVARAAERRNAGGMDCAIRRLRAADLPAMRAMNAMFAAAFGADGGDAYAVRPPSDAWLRRWLARADVIALAALQGDAVVGGLVAYELMKFEQERREFQLFDLAVAEGHRRRGIATALIGWLQRHAARRRGWVVYVQADHRDPPAIALYSKLGAREEVLHFDLPVPGAA
jgi:aminoglycoside 3-N-acetyltransferase I